MYAKIQLDTEYKNIFTEKAFTIRNNGNVFWIPKSALIKATDDYIIIRDYCIKDKDIDYVKLNITDLIDKDLKPLKHLLNQNIIDYFPENLMKHQNLAFEFANKLSCVALFMEMGLGKSKLYIDLADYHYKANNINRVIFFAPPTTLDNFNNELSKWKKTDLKWEIYSIHLLSKKTTDNSIIDFISQIKATDMVIIDESHRIKNIDSNMSQNASIIGNKTKFKIIGTGTSSPNYAMDLVGQFKFLTPELLPESKSMLKKMYKVGNNGEKQELKNEIEIINKFYPYVYALQKKDAIELPELILNRINVSDDKLIEFYKTEVANETTMFLSSEGSLMGYLQNLRKLSSGRNKDNDIVVKNPKIKALDEILQDIPNDSKIIIWHSFYNEIEDITEVIEDNYVLLNGNMTNNEKIYAISEFKSNPKVKYLIATTMVGGVGLNFTEANYNIYFSNGFNLIDRLQSMARSHRIGQNKQVIIYDLVMQGTIDTRIVKSLNNKEDFMEQMQKAMKENKLQVLDEIKNI